MSKSRFVTPRKWALTEATDLAAAQPTVMKDLFIAKAHAASEAGEAGEGAVKVSDGTAEFLTRLGYSEGSCRIVASLYFSGARDLARERQPASHQVFYEEIEPGLVQFDAPGFKAQAVALAAAIDRDAPEAVVETALKAVFQVIDSVAEKTEASLHVRRMSLHDFTAPAKAEYEVGVDNGQVERAMGFVNAGVFAKPHGGARQQWPGPPIRLRPGPGKRCWSNWRARPCFSVADC